MTPVKDGKADFIQDFYNSVRTTAMGFYSGGERLGSTPNTA